MLYKHFRPKDMTPLGRRLMAVFVSPQVQTLTAEKAALAHELTDAKRRFQLLGKKRQAENAKKVIYISVVKIIFAEVEGQ